MAIIKHIPSQNRNYADVIDYLTMQHDEQTGAVILDSHGEMVEREGYLIQGINCTPEDFAELCIRDRLRFGIKGYESEVTTHQYIVSFDPKDADRGLTVDMAQTEGIRLAEKYFPGHRVIVCTHPDGTSHSGNIHVHIVVSSLRFAERAPEESYMRLRLDGSIKPSEYKAGYRHQDTARLRLHMKESIQEYCRQNGFTVSSSRAARKINNQEYKAGTRAQKRLDHDNMLRGQKGIKPAQTTQITRKEELRRVIAEAAQSTNSWDDFAEKLRIGYTRPVEHRAGTPGISFHIRNKLWNEYKASKEHFWKEHKGLSNSYSEELETLFQRLRTHQQSRSKSKGKRFIRGTNYHDEAIKDLRNQIAVIKSKQQRLRLTSKVYQVYSKAAALALSNGLEEETRICLAQMETLTGRLEGRWIDGWQRGSDTYSLVDGKVQSRSTWLQTRKDELVAAEDMLLRIQKTIQQVERLQPEIVNEPFPVEVKITRGVISYKHPDMECWVRGKTLGTDYELEAIAQRLNHSRQSTKENTR